MLSLPSSCTLNGLLKGIPFQLGIKKHIFTSLQKTVEKMKDSKQKICLHMFDEMVIESTNSYQRSIDEIIELENYETEKHPILADHVNVFLVKGIYRFIQQWKQSEFSFSSRPAKAIQLKVSTKNLFKECFSIALEVIASVCDQGQTNNSANNMLLNDSREYLLNEMSNNNMFGFMIANHEIVPLFDVGTSL